MDPAVRAQVEAACTHGGTADLSRRDSPDLLPPEYCTAELDADWDIRATGWHLSVEGDAPLEIDMRFAVPLERMGAVSPSSTANRGVNSVAAVCAAPPGIQPTTALPPITAVLDHG
ncbi:MAG: hypothetical protein ABIS86_09615 [Streptosporangiaceae bacterium]